MRHAGPFWRVLNFRTFREKVGSMWSERDLARIVLRRLIGFLADHFGKTLKNAREDPHVLAFLDYCADPPKSLLLNTFPMRRPLRANLVTRLLGVQILLRESRSPLQLTSVSLNYAQTLVEKHASPVRGARPVSRDLVRRLVKTVDLFFALRLTISSRHPSVVACMGATNGGS